MKDSMSKKFSEKWKEEREKKRRMKNEKKGIPNPPEDDKIGQTLDKALTSEQRIDLKQFEGRHLFIATPAYGGMVGEAYLKAMVRVGILFKTYNLHFTLATIANESLITRGRNTLVSMFMSDPKFTDMIFIDADIHFDAESIIKMWSKNVDIVVGAYPKKMINWKGIRDAAVRGDSEEELLKHQASYVLNIKTDGTGRVPMQNGLIPVYDGGTGFMMFKKSVIEKLIEKNPDLWYKNDLNTDPEYNKWCYALFDTLIDPDTKRYLSEDYTFCRRWQQLGGTIWMDPTIELDHQGAYLFKGNISNQFTYNGPGDQQTDDAIKQSQKPTKPNDSDVNEIEKIQEKTKDAKPE